jgi:hypothetical protein
MGVERGAMQYRIDFYLKKQLYANEKIAFEKEGMIFHGLFQSRKFKYQFWRHKGG